MAYQLGVIQYRGKLGATVGRKKSAGQRANTIAARPQVVSNPRSTAQAAQRMKMAPAVNFYRALRDVLNHSWQGVSYGGASHSRFMKEAMRAPVYPYIPKGCTAPVPAPYKVSMGSIAPLTVTVDNQDGEYAAITSIRVPDHSTIDGFDTLGTFAKFVLDNNPQLQDGDQLTFISAVMGDVAEVLDSGAMFRYSRFVLDTKDTTPMPAEISFPDKRDYVNINGVWLGVNADEKLTFCHASFDEAVDSFFDAGAAIIVSRPSITKGKVTWERSTQSLVLSSSVLEYLARASRYEECLETYKNSYSANSDWYLNGGNNSGSSSAGQVPVILNISNGYETLVDVSGAGTYNIGDLVTVTTNLKSGVPVGGKSFMGWVKDGKTVSTQRTYTFTLEGRTELTASWTTEEEP